MESTVAYLSCHRIFFHRKARIILTLIVPGPRNPCLRQAGLALEPSAKKSWHMDASSPAHGAFLCLRRAEAGGQLTVCSGQQAVGSQHKERRQAAIGPQKGGSYRKIMVDGQQEEKAASGGRSPAGGEVMRVKRSRRMKAPLWPYRAEYPHSRAHSLTPKGPAGSREFREEVPIPASGSPH